MKKITLVASLFVLAFSLTKAQSVTTLAGSTTPGNNNATGTLASFSLPIGVTTDGTYIYVADAANNLIRQINIGTGVVTTLAGSGAATSTDGTALGASFNAPYGIVYDPNTSALYVADYGGNKIRKVTIGGGIVTTVAGTGATGFADGPGLSATFHNPTALTTDGAGNLYVADVGNTEIRQIIVSTGTVNTVAGSTTSGSTDGYGAAAQFSSPSGIVYAEGNLYVTDMGNNEIRQIVPSTGQVTTVYGAITAGSADGFGTNASFNSPYGITFDGSSNLYVSDMGNNSIRKIFLSTGRVYTYAVGGLGSANGSVLNAKFSQPHGLTTDVNGNVYIADANNNEIRKIGTCATAISASIVSPSSGPQATNVCYGLNDTVIGIENGGVNPPYTFYWNGVASTDTLVANLPNNTIYSLTVVDAIGCHSDTANTYVMVDNPGAISVTVLGAPNDTICPGADITLFGSGGNGGGGNYTWTPSTGFVGSPYAGSVSPTTTTSYTLAENGDGNGCVPTPGTITVVVSSPVVSMVGNVLSGLTICSGIADTLHAVVVGNGPFSYRWSNNGATTDSIIATNQSEYNVNVSDFYGCTSNADSVIRNGNNPALVVTGSTLICSGNSTTLEINGAESYSWAPNGDFGDPTDSIQNISPFNTTTYTVTGVNGECKSNQYVTINVASLPGISISGPTSVCAGSSVTLYGNGADVYQWTGGPNTPGYQVFPKGSGVTYIVTGTDLSTGCSNTSSTFVMVNTLPSVTISGATSVCLGSTVVITANGADTYQWSDGTVSQTDNISPQNTSTFEVTGTSTVTGCSDTASQVVVVNQLPTINISGNSSICLGSSVTLTAFGADTYQWNAGPATAAYTLSPIGIATYTVTGTNTTTTCSNSATQTVQVSSLPNVTISGTTTICMGSNTTLFASGGDQFTWAGGPSTEGYNVSPSTNATYTVTGVSLSSGCSNTATQLVTVNSLPNVNITGNTSVCSGSSTTLTGTGADTYTWITSTGTGPNTAAFNFSPASTTSVMVTGTNTTTTCSNNYIQAITVNALPNVTISGGNAVCNGSNVTLTANGTDTYQWAGGPATAAYTFTPGATATYTVTGTNSLTLCSGTATETVQVNSLPNVTISGNTTICNGSNTTLSASGADQFSWSGGPSTISYNVSPSANTTYTVTGIDLSSGCSSSITQLVTVNLLPNVTITGNTSVCNGSSTTLTGTGADTYTWITSTGTGPNTAAFNFSPTNTTSVTVTGTSTLTSCSNSAMQTVTVNALPNITISGSSTICNGSSTTLTANGGDTYQWTGGPATANYSVSPGSSLSYMVTGTNTTTTCSNTATQVVTVNTPQAVVANAYPSTNICQGGQVTLYGSGGSTYSWSSGVNDGIAFRPSATATYTVTSISSGFTVNSNVTVYVNPLPTITITATPKDSICQGNSVTLTSTGTSVSYSWNNGVTSGVAFSPATSNVYEVTGTDANGCMNSAQLPIVVNNLPSISGSVSPQAVCQGSSVTLNGNGGSTYSWTGGVTNGVAFTPAISGTYTVTGTNAAGCSNTAIVGVTINPIPVMSDSAIPSTAVCQGNSVALIGKGASSYSWSGGIVNGISFVPATSGTYTVTGFGANGCTSKDSITIKINNKVILTPLIVNTTCALNNGAVKVNAASGTPPYIYSWSTVPVNTTDSIGSLSPGTYIITVNDANQCSSYSSIDIASSTAPILSVSTDESTCGNATGAAYASVAYGTPPYRFSWSNGDTTYAANNLTLGTYIVTVTDVNSCTTVGSADISNQNGPSITANAVVNVNCNGQNTGAINIGVSGGAVPYTFVWSNGATTQNINGLAAGPYQVTVADANGCSALGNFTISQPSALVLVKSIVKADCGVPDGAAIVTVSGGAPPYSYLWNNGRTSDSLATANAGAYYVTVLDHNGCKIDSDQVSISNVNGPVPSILITGSASCNSGGVTLTGNVTAGTAPYNYLWSTGNTSTAISHIPAGNYNLQVTDHLGCIGVADTTIFEVPPPVAPICMVTVDSATQKNMVIWNKYQSTGIASYNIYKESTQAGVYLKIANVPYSYSSTYIDTLSNPQTRSWRYELSQVDSCGNESALSPAHKTMHLTVNKGITGGTVNLIWDNYEGMTFYTYYVYRDTALTGLTKIDSIPNNIFTYTDANPPVAANLYYRIQVVNPDPCLPSGFTPSVRSINYNASKSNTGNFVFNPAGIASVSKAGAQLTIFPNPNTGVFTFTLVQDKGAKSVSLSVVNELGQVVMTNTYNDVAANFSKQLDLSSLAKGVYFLKTISDNSTLYNKVVIQ